MTGTEPFASNMLERIAYHQDAITYLEACIAEMERGDIRHRSQCNGGRLSVDSTGRMIKIAEASKQTHEDAVRLWAV